MSLVNNSLAKIFRNTYFSSLLNDYKYEMTQFSFLISLSWSSGIDPVWVCTLSVHYVNTFVLLRHKLRRFGLITDDTLQGGKLSGWNSYSQHWDNKDLSKKTVLISYANSYSTVMTKIISLKKTTGMSARLFPTKTTLT